MSNSYSIKSILVSLIESIDAYNFLLKNHHRKTAIIAYQLGNEFGLDSTSLSNLVLTASIHDIGALHIKERDQLLYVDAQNPEPHEIMGEKMLEGFKPLEPIRKIIRHHHIKYSDVVQGHTPQEDVPFECYFLHLADRIDVLLTTAENEAHAQEDVTSEINKRFGTFFFPELQDTFNKLAATEDFWENIYDSSFHELLFMMVEEVECDLEQADIDGLASIFAKIVDFKSNWTVNHSKSVSVLAESIGKILGMDEEKCHQLKIAGYLHDIGKIAIPSEVLDKPASLDHDEFKVMKTHAKYSSLILSKTPFLGNISRWASSHHEKRDKSGYPMRISDKSFETEMDILAYADIFAALAENRPYRKAMPKEKILDILEEFAGEKLSESVFVEIKDNMDLLYNKNLETQKV